MIPPLEPPVFEIPPSVTKINGSFIIPIAAVRPGTTDTDGLVVLVENLPVGAAFSRGEQAGNQWVFTPQDFGEVELEFPSGFSGTVNLEIIASSNGASRRRFVTIDVQSTSQPVTTGETPTSSGGTSSAVTTTNEVISTTSTGSEVTSPSSEVTSTGSELTSTGSEATTGGIMMSTSNEVSTSSEVSSTSSNGETTSYEVTSIGSDGSTFTSDSTTAEDSTQTPKSTNEGLTTGIGGIELC